MKLRFQIFKENLDLIRSTNKKGLSYTLGVNQFADWSWEEFQKHRLGAAQNCSATLKGNHQLTDVVLPESLADIIAAARKDAGEYWTAVMKDQPMPEALQDLVRVEAVSAGHSSELKEELIIIEDFERPLKLEEDEKKSTFADDIEPRPNISAYGEDGDLKGKKPPSFVEDIEPRPNISAYGEDGDLKGKKSPSFVENIEPRPNISVYGSDGGGLNGEEKQFASDFEQEPNISVYHG